MIFDLDIPFFLQQDLVLHAPCGRGVEFEPRIVLERRLDAPEVIKVPMREHHEIDLAPLQHPIDAVPGKYVIHPIVAPAGIKQDLALIAVERRDSQKRRVAAGIFWVPGNAVLGLLGAAVFGHVLFEASVVEPAGLGQNIDLEALDRADGELVAHCSSPVLIFVPRVRLAYSCPSVQG